MPDLLPHQSLLHTGLRNVASCTAVGVTLIIAGHTMVNEINSTRWMKKGLIALGIAYIAVATVICFLVPADFERDIKLRMKHWFSLLSALGVLELGLIAWSFFVMLLR